MPDRAKPGIADSARASSESPRRCQSAAPTRNGSVRDARQHRMHASLPQHEPAQLNLDEIDRVTALVDDLLALSRKRRGAMPKARVLDCLEDSRALLAETLELLAQDDHLTSASDHDV